MRTNRHLGRSALATLLATIVAAAAFAGGDGDDKKPEAKKQTADQQDTKAAILRLEQEVKRLKEKEGIKDDTDMAPTRPMPADAPFTLRGDIAFRFDLTDHRSREIGLIPDEVDSSFRNRTRLHIDSAIRNNASATVSLTTVTAQNPAAPYLTFGDGYRGKQVYFRTAYVNYYFMPKGQARPTPFTPTIIAGKMDNPFWRAQIGLPANPTGSGIPNYFIPNFQSEIAWDFDVTPEGVAVRYPVKIGGGEQNKIDFMSSYYQINVPSRQRFTGDTSDLYQIYSQVHGKFGDLEASFQHNYVRNLNSGLHNPIFDQSGIAIEHATPSSAFLLRAPFQATNAHYGVNNNVFTFGADTFNIYGGTVQYMPQSMTLGKGIKPFFVGEILHNSSVDYVQDGYGLSLGVNRGTNKRDNFGAWITYRDVDADATLGPFADSDLGGGTDYRGYQIGTLYHIQDSLIIRAAWQDFKGSPKKNNGNSRLLLDIVKLF